MGYILKKTAHAMSKDTIEELASEIYVQSTHSRLTRETILEVLTLLGERWNTLENIEVLIETAAIRRGLCREKT